jgi:3-isopropylmalate dehydrogenase
LRKALGLYANIRPVRLFASLMDRSPLKEERILGTDLVVYRELTSGIYFGDKGRVEGGSAAFDTCYYTVEEITRIAKMAFEAATRRRGLLTLVDKANVLESSRLWREVVQKMALEYPDVSVDYLFVDNAAMQVVQQPSRFDVILTENMFGDIISDETSVITGSIGLLPSASLGLSSSLFEPIHGSYPEAAGKDIANPLATILSLAMLLEHVGLIEEARRVEAAVELVIDKGLFTPDLNDELFISCSKVGDVVAMMVESDLDEDTSFDNIFEGNLPLI